MDPRFRGDDEALSQCHCPMDNVTHTLIGALLGETVARTTQPVANGIAADVRRNLFVTAAAVGSNLPDVDVLYSFFGGKVNYLLQHRGHSHTIIGALLLAAAAIGVARWWLARRAQTVTAPDLFWLAGIFATTALLHIGMDFTNNYGVHPFWPFNNRWLYGDSVFIAEPLFWTACAPLAFTFRTRASRVLVFAVLAAGVGLSWFSGFVPRGPAIVLTAITAAMLVLARRAPARVSLMTGIATWMIVTATFVVSSQVAARRAESIAHELEPGTRLLDRVLTPMPANPLCWEVMFVQTLVADVTVSRAMLSLAPAMITAEACLSRSMVLPTTAPLHAFGSPTEAQIKWYGGMTSSAADLTRLVASNCEAAAAMRFIRVPWIATIDGATVLGDLRYDREKSLGFAELQLYDAPASCPRFVPPWRPPRLDLLETQQK
jgi:inner membrane protein